MRLMELVAPKSPRSVTGPVRVLPVRVNVRLVRFESAGVWVFGVKPIACVWQAQPPGAKQDPDTRPRKS